MAGKSTTLRCKSEKGGAHPKSSATRRPVFRKPAIEAVRSAEQAKDLGEKDGLQFLAGDQQKRKRKPERMRELPRGKMNGKRKAER
jgi:hypothetical protein